MRDWSIDYPAAGVRAAGHLEFGDTLSRYIMTSYPNVDSPEFATDDTNGARVDGRSFGVDYIGGTTVAFELTTDGADDAEGLALYEAFRRVWRADAVRLTPGAVATLTSHHGRRAFGRPRRVARDPRFSHNGRSDITADFATVDDLWYGDERSVDVRLVPTLGGGLVAPLVAPLTTTADSTRRQVFEVGGELPTWATVQVYGDIVNPEVEIPGVLRQRFAVNLAYDQSITADGRPWRRSVLRQDGASLAGALTRTSTSITDMLIPPGRHEIVLSGASLSGTARATVRWSEAFTSY